MSRAPSIEPAYEHVAEQLRERIRSMRDGQQLPTVRRLMAEYSVGQSVVDKAMTLLRQEGIVDSRVGRGTFARPQAARKVDLFDVVLFDADAALRTGSFHDVLFSQLGQIVGTRGQSIRITNLGPDKPYTRFEAMLNTQACKAVFIDGLRDVGLLEILDRRDVPYVVLFSNHVLPQANSLQIDNAQAMELIFDHLQALGHRRLGYVHSFDEQTPFYHDLWKRHELFYRLVAQRGLETRAEWVRYGAFEADPAYEATRAMLASDDRPTAILTGDHLAQGVYRAVREANLRIGEDVSVVGFDDMPWAAYLDPPLTTVRTPIHDVAEHAVRVMDRLLKGGKDLAPEFLKASLVVRSSTGPAPR